MHFNSHYLELLRDDHEDALTAGATGYYSNSFIQIALPHRKTSSNQIIRVDGNKTLVITDMLNNGIPFGVIPRLIFCWISTEAFKRKEQVLALDHSLSDFMRKTGVFPIGNPDGRTINNFRYHLSRTLNLGIAWGKTDDIGVSGKMRLVTSDYDLLWTRHNRSSQSYIKLGKEYYDSCLNGPVVIDTRALRALKRSPLALDIYVWGTYRMSYCNRPTKIISWVSLQDYFGSSYAYNENGRKNFKRNFLKQLAKVCDIYRGLNIKQVSGGLMLFPGQPHVRKLC